MIDTRLSAIARKLAEGKRLDAADGVALFETHDLHALGAMADQVRRRRHGNKAYYIVNRHINYTNLCRLSCKVCGFSRKSGDPEAYELSVQQVVEQAAAAQRRRAHEVHITGGLHPDWTIARYEQMLVAIKQACPQLHIKAFTAVEIDHIASLSGTSSRAVLQRLIAAGLGSLPGGGAEIFDQDLRRELFPCKIDAQRWLDIHAEAHGLGLRTTATMLYGHRESCAQRVDHLLRLRQLQDQTGGFLAMVPLCFIPPAGWDRPEESGTTGVEDLKTVAASRLLLDNFEHIKTFWVVQGLKLSQVALSFGADDIDGTIEHYEIASADGQSGKGAGVRQVSAANLEGLIRQAGMEPVRRDSLYRAVTS